MSDLNKMIAMGHLTHDAELKDINGTPLVKLRLATNHEYLFNDERRTTVEFHRIEVWGNLTASCASYKKGYQIYIEGPLLTNSWEDPKGTKRSDKYIRASHVSFLGLGSQRPPAELPTDEVPL